MNNKKIVSLFAAILFCCCLITGCSKSVSSKKVVSDVGSNSSNPLDSMLLSDVLFDDNDIKISVVESKLDGVILNMKLRFESRKYSPSPLDIPSSDLYFNLNGKAIYVYKMDPLNNVLCDRDRAIVSSGDIDNFYYIKENIECLGNETPTYYIDNGVDPNDGYVHINILECDSDKNSRFSGINHYPKVFKRDAVQKYLSSFSQ